MRPLAQRPGMPPHQCTSSLLPYPTLAHYPKNPYKRADQPLVHSNPLFPVASNAPQAYAWPPSPGDHVTSYHGQLHSPPLATSSPPNQLPTCMHNSFTYSCHPGTPLLLASCSPQSTATYCITSPFHHHYLLPCTCTLPKPSPHALSALTSTSPAGST